MNPIHFDCMGNQIQVGDYVAIDHRDGNSSRMSISCVVELDPNDETKAVLAGGSFNWRGEFWANSRRSKTVRLNECVKIQREFVAESVEVALSDLVMGGKK